MSGPFKPGERIDAWRIESHLARGGMGHVYRALDERTATPVAIKVLDTLVGDASLVERFLREAQLAAQVDRGGGVVRVHSAGQHRGLPYFVMELVSGRSLAATFEDPLGVDPPELAGWVRDVARTIQRCHEAGVVHRDLKPANLLLRDDGRVLVADFGLALHASAQRLTRTGDVVGTPAYMAPEQVTEGAQAAGPPLDVYGLGAILYHGLCGRAPYPQPGAVAALDALAHGPPPPPSAVARGVDPALEAICLRALQRDPGKRTASAGALADALQAYLDGQASAQGSPGAWIAASVVAVVVVAGVVAWILRPARVVAPTPAPVTPAPVAAVTTAPRLDLAQGVTRALDALAVSEDDERAVQGDAALRAALAGLEPWQGDPRLTAEAQAGLDARAERLLGDLRRLEQREGHLLTRLRRLCAATGAHPPQALVAGYRSFAEGVAGEVDLSGRGDTGAFQRSVRRHLVLSLLTGEPPPESIQNQVRFVLRTFDFTPAGVFCASLFLVALRCDVEYQGWFPYRGIRDALTPEAFAELARYPDLASARYAVLAPELGALDQSSALEPLPALIAALERVLAAPVPDLGPGMRRTVEAQLVICHARLGHEAEARRLAEGVLADPAPVGSVRDRVAFEIEGWLSLAEREAVWRRQVELADAERERSSVLTSRQILAQVLVARGAVDEAIDVLFEGSRLGRLRLDGAVRRIERDLCALLLERGRAREALPLVERWGDEELADLAHLAVAMRVVLALRAFEEGRAYLARVQGLVPEEALSSWREALETAELQAPSPGPPDD